MLDYLEKVYYKLIIDLLKVAKKYNFEAENISVLEEDIILLKKLKLTYSNFDKINTFYINNIVLNESFTDISCELGNNIGLDSLVFNSSVNKSDVSFIVNNLIGDYLLKSNILEKLDVYDSRFLQKQTSTLTSLLNTYKKIYNYVFNTRENLNEGDSYCVCYVEKYYWEGDDYARNYDIILKYNLFDLKSQNIDIKDRRIIENILA